MKDYFPNMKRATEQEKEKLIKELILDEKVNLSEKELLDLKSRIPKMGGAGEAYGLAQNIPKLVDEIIELRKQLEHWKNISGNIRN